jgi:hypothetical protein
MRRVTVIAMVVLLAGCPSRPPDAGALAASMKAKMKLPYDVDGETRLDDVRGTSKTELGYFLTLTKTTKATLDPNLGKSLESMLRGGACQDPNYRVILKAGFSVAIVYRTQDQADVARIVIAPKDCGL